MTERADLVRLFFARQSTLVAVVSGVMFLVILVLKLLITEPGWGFPLLYDIPVALLAVSFGVRGGLAGALIGMACFAIGDSVADIHTNAAGYVSRGLTFVVLGILLGAYSDRSRKEQERIQRAELGRRHAAEINDNVVQRLVLTKYALDRGATADGAENATAALREAQRLVSSFLEDEVEPGSLRRATSAGDAPADRATAEGPPSARPGAR
jgi:uncharacterized membrane protein